MTEEAQLLIDQINCEAPAKTIDELAEDCFIPQGIEIPKPEVIFALDGIPVFTKKSLSTLIGKAKSGKTTCTAWVIAQIIKEGLNVLWIDTEQGLYYASRTQHWILNIAGIAVSPSLKFYDLKIHNPSVRTKIIELLIQQVEPDIVIIDGIRDLVFDINEPKEATITIGNLMKWADIHNCHILSILHQNKGNEHARGHLGSEMINKSETVIKVSQDENKITICEPEFTRGEAFPIFAFDRDSYGLPQLVNYVPQISGGESNRKKTLPIDIDNKTHYECLERAFGVEYKLPYGELQSAISAAFEYYGMAMGIVKTRSFFQFYLQQGYISKMPKDGSKTFYEIIKKDNSNKNIIKNNLPYNDNDEDVPF